ncbi:MAG: hypothetical protein ACN6OB_07790 [Chryseobacterium jejuense]|uniref:hypothetical protein n=1 Tax=Chryseobacterium jejuense TaxID=445960 RepID=UPI003D136D1B
MKKFLLTATMLVAFTALSKAQQGRVGINTSTPAATLDVVASTDASRPDALLVPRLSRAELEAKTGAYADGNATAASAQNGALVFINALGGAGTGKTANVTATGFYYYDGTNTNNVWKPVGGGGSSTPQRYEGIRGAATILTSTNAYSVLATDFIIVTKAAGAMTIDLPDPAANVGRMIIVSNNNTAPGFVTVNSAGNNTLSNGQLALNRGKVFVSDGTSWIAISYS